MESNQVSQDLAVIRRTLNNIDNRDNPASRKAAFIRSAFIALAAAERTRHGLCIVSHMVQEAEDLWQMLPEQYR